MTRPIQYFSDEYLEHCQKMSSTEIAEFLENFRLTYGEQPKESKLISLKVPENLLEAFKTKAKMRGVKYQTQIKALMQEWLAGELNEVTSKSSSKRKYR